MRPAFPDQHEPCRARSFLIRKFLGAKIFTTVEVEDSFTKFNFSHYTISFLTDDIIRLPYVEIDGQLRKIMVVIKMRGGNHAKHIRECVITDKGVMVLGPRQTDTSS